MSLGWFVAQLVPPETTVGELLVDLGAVVVVVVGSGAVVAVVGDPEDDAEDPEDDVEEDDDETEDALAAPPGIS
jgi:hypothetical protein